MFEQLNHLHKRAALLGKGKNFAKRTHRPLSKDQNLSKKMFFDNFGKLPTKTREMVPKRIP
jgi:hypothetical protein